MYKALTLPREIEGMLAEFHRILCERLRASDDPRAAGDPNTLARAEVEHLLLQLDSATGELTGDELRETATRLEELVDPSTDTDRIVELVNTTAAMLREEGGKRS